MKQLNGLSLFHDIGTILLSILLAVVLARTGILQQILASLKELQFLGSFIAGIFLTSLFTTAPAVVAFGEIAKVHALLETALFGAMGATLGDFIIFRFVRQRFSTHLFGLMRERKVRKRLRALIHLRFFYWFTFLVGSFMIASPLPDELGVGLLGFSRVRASVFIPLSFVFHFVGIYLIASAARTLL